MIPRLNLYSRSVLIHAIRALVMLAVFFSAFLFASLWQSQLFAEQPPEQDDLNDLMVNYIGTTDRASVFDWRRRSLLLYLNYGQQIEMNIFETTRKEIRTEFPSRDSIWGVGLSKVTVDRTSASDDLSLTPFRQPGRPSRYELVAGYGVPVIEGVGNHMFSGLYTGQFLLNIYGEARLLFYEGVYSSANEPKELAKEIFSMSLSDEQVAKLRKHRAPHAMDIQRSRLNLLSGLKLYYFLPVGWFATSHWLLGLPLHFSDKDSLSTWWEMQIGVGYVF